MGIWPSWKIAIKECKNNPQADKKSRFCESVVISDDEEKCNEQQDHLKNEKTLWNTEKTILPSDIVNVAEKYGLDKISQGIFESKIRHKNNHRKQKTK